jgi:AraC-like DNA-binding protein
VAEISARAPWLVAGAPDERLWPYVDRYVGYRERADIPLVRREVPGGSVVLVVGWGAPLDVVDPRAPARGAFGVASFAGGLFDSYVTTSTLGVGRGVQLMLSPLTARRILGLPMGELANSVVAVDDLPGGWLPALRARLAAAPDWPRRFAALDTAIAGRLATTEPPDARVRWAWDRLAGSGGRTAIGDLADEIGWSRRHLAAVFTREVGLPPKTVARLLRFERAYSRVDRVDHDGGWAAVAAGCGYYDQAHLIRDFREFAGAMPTALAAVRPASANPS